MCTYVIPLHEAGPSATAAAPRATPAIAANGDRNVIGIKRPPREEIWSVQVFYVDGSCVTYSQSGRNQMDALHTLFGLLDHVDKEIKNIRPHRIH